MIFGFCPLVPAARRLTMANIEKNGVAIVDDDHAVRDSLQFLLEIVGYRVETFASAAEFLKGEKQRIACLILDYHMPEMTGLELAERIRADGASIPILLVTASPSSTILARAAEVGVNRVLEKPATEEDLLDFVDAATKSGARVVTFQQAYEAAAARYAPEVWVDLSPAVRINAIYEEMRRLDAQALTSMDDAPTTHGQEHRSQTELRRADQVQLERVVTRDPERRSARPNHERT
jgi:two-component system, LuxR family, response regulator FixJ